MKYAVLIVAVCVAGCTDDVAAKGCALSAGGCCEVDADCTVLGENQACSPFSECVCNSPTGECDACLTDEDCERAGFVCRERDGIYWCVETGGIELRDFRDFEEFLFADVALLDPCPLPIEVVSARVDRNSDDQYLFESTIRLCPRVDGDNQECVGKEVLVGPTVLSAAQLDQLLASFAQVELLTTTECFPEILPDTCSNWSFTWDQVTAIERICRFQESPPRISLESSGTIKRALLSLASALAPVESGTD